MVRNHFDSDSIGKAVSRFNQAVRQVEHIVVSNDYQLQVLKPLAFSPIAKLQGFEKALEHAGLSDLIGKSNMEIYMGLLDYFVGSSNTLDDSIVWDSMAELLKELFLDVPGDKSFEDIINV